MYHPLVLSSGVSIISSQPGSQSLIQTFPIVSDMYMYVVYVCVRAHVQVLEALPQAFEKGLNTSTKEAINQMLQVQNKAP